MAPAIYSSQHILNRSFDPVNNRLKTGVGAVTGDLLPDADGTRDIGSSALQWEDGYLSGNLTSGII